MAMAKVRKDMFVSGFVFWFVLLTISLVFAIGFYKIIFIS